MRRYLVITVAVITVAAVYVGSQIARVPEASGTFLHARAVLSDAGFDAVAVDGSGAAYQPHDMELTVSQDPAAGTLRMFGSTVTLRTRAPQERVTVPDVVGTRLSDAALVVNRAGLELATGGWIPDDGIVASTIPSPGVSVRFGSRVIYTLQDQP